MKRTTVDQSGFGGGYENTIQKMLWNGIRVVEENPEFAERALKSYRAFQGVFGVAEPMNEEGKQFDELLMEGVEDATGAMHHQVVKQLCYIAQNGREKWLEEIRKDDPKRIFEWDGTEASCPPTPPELADAEERGRAIVEKALKNPTEH